MKIKAMNQHNVIEEIESLLKKGNAHASFKDAVKNIAFEHLGKVPDNLPYSIWQITEHIRIAQKDILDFSSGENYKELNWPDDYWSKEAAPKNEKAWKDCLQQIDDDLAEFIKLLEKADDTTEPLKHGNGQTLLREALLIADHTSYHTGEIIVLRRLLGIWKK